MSRTQEATNHEERRKGIKSLNGVGGVQNAFATETDGKGNKDGKGGGRGKGKANKNGTQGEGSGGTGPAASDPLAVLSKDGKRFCFFNVRGGRCTRSDCPFSHDTPPKATKDAIIAFEGKPRSMSPRGRRTTSRTPNATTTTSTAAPAQTAVQTEEQQSAQQQQPKGNQPKFGGLKQLWCPFFLKGNCKKGDDCTLPHISPEAKEALQKSIQRGRASLGLRADP